MSPLTPSPLEHLKAFALVFLSGILTTLSWIGLVVVARRRRRP